MKKRGKQTKLNAIAKGSGEGSAGASKDSGESESKAKTDLSKMDFKLENKTTKDGRCVPWMEVRERDTSGVNGKRSALVMLYRKEYIVPHEDHSSSLCLSQLLYTDQMPLPCTFDGSMMCACSSGHCVSGNMQSLLHHPVCHPQFSM